MDFPPSYLQPLTTALGPAWPRPRVRRIMENLENVQKRMVANAQLRGGIQMTPKKLRKERWEGWMEEYRLLEQELNRLMESFRKFPATKEQFKRPDVALSDCCDAYVNEVWEDEGQTTEKHGMKCVECGNFCKTYKRIERENWKLEYEQAMADQRAEAEAQDKDMGILERMKQMQAPPAEKNPLKGGFLIS